MTDDFRWRVERASELIEVLLRELVDDFGVSAHWQFARDPDGVVGTKLTLAASPSRGPARATSPVLGQTAFLDDRSIRSAVSPTLIQFTHRLSDLIQVDFDRVGKELRQDIESYLAASEG